MYCQWQFFYIGGFNVVYVDELYEFYLIDFNFVLEDWCVYFEKLFFDGVVEFDVFYLVVCEYFLFEVKNKFCVQKVGVGVVSSEYECCQVWVFYLIVVYCNWGYQVVKLDLFGLMECEVVFDLELVYYGLSKVDMDMVFQIGNLFIGKLEVILCEIMDCLKGIYCFMVGCEYMYIVNIVEKCWFQQWLEGVCSYLQYGVDIKSYIFECLIVVEGLEKYLGSCYFGIKCFGLEGGELMILLMDEMIQ